MHFSPSQRRDSSSRHRANEEGRRESFEASENKRKQNRVDFGLKRLSEEQPHAGCWKAGRQTDAFQLQGSTLRAWGRIL